MNILCFKFFVDVKNNISCEHFMFQVFVDVKNNISCKYEDSDHELFDICQSWILHWCSCSGVWTFIFLNIYVSLLYIE